MTIISTVALLCQVSIGGMSLTIEKVQEAQLNCQKYYVGCLQNPSEPELRRCILEKK